jgi:hypothetical protein
MLLTGGSSDDNFLILLVDLYGQNGSMFCPSDSSLIKNLLTEEDWFQDSSSSLDFFGMDVQDTAFLDN